MCVCVCLLYCIVSIGAGESGKTTVVKQMKILHKDGFSNEWVYIIHYIMYYNNDHRERLQNVADIRNNIREIMQVCL